MADPRDTPNTRKDELLEGNISQLLARSHDPPRMSDEGRARVLEQLRKLRQAKARGAKSRSRRWVILAAAAAALVVWVLVRGGGEPGQTLDNPGAPPRQVVLADGTTVTLDHGAEVKELGARKVRVVRGEVMFDVVRGAGPFSVLTSEGEVVVLGTRFLISAGKGRVRAAVIRGKVRVQNARGRVTLGAGEESILNPGKPPTRRPARRLSHLASWIRTEQPRAHDDNKPARRGNLLARNPVWQRQEFPLPLRKLNVDVHVEDQVARVAVDQTFFNPQPQQLEGVYSFPLPPGAAISRLAMYVGPKLMEAGVVERQAARKIYEDIVYTRRDPALLEWMSGNTFQVRIFPLPGRTEKRIVLSYTQALDRLYDDTQLRIPVPEIDRPVDAVAFRVRLAGCARCEVRSTSHDVQQAIEGGDRLVTFSAVKHEIGDDLLLTIRRPDRGPRVATSRQKAARYWIARVRPTIRQARPLRRRGRRWVILNDTSASRSALELRAQAHLVERFLAEVDLSDEVSLYAFDATLRGFWSTFLRVGAVDPRKVSAFLSRQSRDGVGATNLELALRRAAAELDKAGGDLDPHILYIGDGVATDGALRLEALRTLVRGRATFVAVAVGDRVDAPLLKSLAAATGGLLTRFSPGDDLRWRTFDLVATLNTPRVVDLSVALLDRDGRPVAARAHPSTRQLSSGEELSVVARVSGALPAALKLQGRVDGREWSSTVELSAAPLTRDAGYLPRLWARRHIDALLAEHRTRHKKEIVALGMKHFLVTPFTSLLVLENEAMYRKYRVRRGGGGWAAYQLPKRIKVVREPGAPKRRAIPGPGRTVERRPLPLLRSYGGGSILIYNTDLGDTYQHGRFFTLRDGLSPRTGSLLSGEDQDLGGVRTGGWKVPAGSTGAGEPAAASDAPMGLGLVGTGRGGGGVGAGVIGLDVLPGQQVTWGGGFLPRRTAVDRHLARLIAANSAGSAGILGLLPRTSGRHLASIFGGRGARSTYPVAYASSAGPHMADLTEHAPGLFPTPFDHMRAALLRRGSPRGSITPAARRLLTRARHAAGGQRYSSPSGAVFEVDADGRFRARSETAALPAEQVEYDGLHVTHAYPELGLVTRRQAEGARAALLGPFVVPDAAALTRWYRVAVKAPRTLTLTLEGTRGKDAGVIELALDDRDRVASLRRIGGGAAAVRIERAGDRVTVTAQGQRTVFTAAAWSGKIQPRPRATDRRAAVVEMPLRPHEYWEKKLSAAAAGSAAWRHALHQIMAGHAAHRRQHLLRRDLLVRLKHPGDLTPGELALMSRAFRGPAGDDLGRALSGKDTAGTLLSRYLSASRRNTSVRLRSELFDRLARDAGDTLIGMLASYRAALAAMESGNRRLALARCRAFATTYRRPVLRFILATLFSNRWSYRAIADSAGLWDLVAADGRWHSMAQIRAARLEIQARKFDAAASRLERLFDRVPGDVSLAPTRADPLLSTAFRRSSRGQAGWKLYWRGLRTRLLRVEDDGGALLALARIAVGNGEAADLPLVAARARARKIEDPMILLLLAGQLTSGGHLDQAGQLLAPLLAAPDSSALLPAALRQAAWVATRQKRHAEAARHLERAYALASREPMRLAALRSTHRQLLQLHSKAARAVTGQRRGTRVDRLLTAAARWRRFDPDNPAIDRQVATLLYSLDLSSEGWRYLSTGIERHPGQGKALGDVAGALERDGRLKQAAGLWKRAFEAEPTNPTWLWRHAKNQLALKRDANACKLLKQILTGKWHSRFWFKPRARTLRKNRCSGRAAR